MTLWTAASYISVQIWIQTITIFQEHWNKPHSMQVKEDNIQRETTNLSRKGVHYVSKNIFRRCEACSEAGDKHSETLVQNKVS